VHGICDGERFFLLPAAQDHKRIGDGDRGPNTGGMGAYSPAPLITPSLAARIEREIFERALAGMAAEDCPFRGALFAGIMVTPEGEPKLLEFNVRFGDPETQVLTLVVEGDFAETLASAARGELDETAMHVSLDHAVCVVLAAHGDAISGLDEAEQVEGATVFHAGTSAGPSGILTAGGRVLGVAARGASLREAHERAYRAAGQIRFDGMQLRRDIAARALSVHP
jgi:phosphoribosylamine--glycine ligase